MASDCGQIVYAQPGRAINQTKTYQLGGTGGSSSISVDVNNAYDNFRSLRGGGDQYVDLYLLRASATVTPSTTVDVPGWMVWASILSQLVIRDPAEKVNVDGFSWIVAILAEHRHWDWSSMTIPHDPAAAPITITGTIPLPGFQQLMLPGDTNAQYDTWVPLADLRAGGVDITGDTTGLGPGRNTVAYPTAGFTIDFLISCVERQTMTSDGLGVYQSMRSMLKDFPIADTAPTGPLTPGALIRWLGASLGRLNALATSGPGVWSTVAGRWASSTGKFVNLDATMITQLILYGAESPWLLSPFSPADARASNGNGVWSSAQAAPGMVVPVIWRAMSDPTDWTVADSFGYQIPQAFGTGAFVSANMPKSIASWIGPRNGAAACAPSTLVAMPSGAKVPATALLQVPDARIAALASALPARQMINPGALAAPNSAASPAPISPLTAVQ